MPTFVERQNASGKKKIKAICRVWVDGKQVNKTKSFDTRAAAEEWAAVTESQMKIDKQRTVLTQINEQKPQAAINQSSIFDELIWPIERAIQNMRFGLGNKPISLLGSRDIIGYLYNRHNAGASKEQLKLEADIIYQTVRRYDQQTGERLSNVIQMAINTARSDGLL